MMALSGVSAMTTIRKRRVSRLIPREKSGAHFAVDVLLKVNYLVWHLRK